MKPAKKRSIMLLAFLMIPSTFVTTALAENANRAEPAVQVVSLPDMAFDFSVIKTNQTFENIGLSIEYYDDSADSAGAVIDSWAVKPESQAVPEKTLNVFEQAVDTGADSDSNYLPDSLLSQGQKIAISALQFKGTKYVYGAATPSVGFDCSGFANYVYKQLGYEIPRTARLQYHNGTTVDKADLQPGDLVFFATSGGHSVSHVGIYIGNNTFIHAPRTGKTVMISSLDSSYWTRTWVGAKRIISSDISLSIA